LSGGLVNELGIGEGDRIAYLGENAPELLVLLFACARIGAILVPLNARMTVAQHRYYLQNSEPRCLIVESPISDHAKTCLQDLSSIVLIGFGGEATDDLDKFRNGIAIAIATEGLFDDKPVLIAYTSGSSGNPKGAVLTNQTLFCGGSCN